MATEMEELRECIASLEANNNDVEIEDLRQHIGRSVVVDYSSRCCKFVYTLQL